jgi:hypothetical protein
MAQAPIRGDIGHHLRRYPTLSLPRDSTVNMGAHIDV